MSHRRRIWLYLWYDLLMSWCINNRRHLTGVSLLENIDYYWIWMFLCWLCLSGLLTSVLKTGILSILRRIEASRKVGYGGQRQKRDREETVLFATWLLLLLLLIMVVLSVLHVLPNCWRLLWWWWWRWP